MNILDQMLWDVRTGDDVDQCLPSRVVLRIDAYLFCQTYAIHALMTHSVDHFLVDRMQLSPLYLIERTLIDIDILNDRAVVDSLFVGAW